MEKGKNRNETQKENLPDKLCRIMNETVIVDLSPADIFTIYGVPCGGRGAVIPVIPKFPDTDTKIQIIKNYSVEKAVTYFSMNNNLLR